MARFSFHEPSAAEPGDETIPAQAHYMAGTLTVTEDEADECCRVVGRRSDAGLLLLPSTHVENEHPEEFTQIEFPEWWLG